MILVIFAFAVIKDKSTNTEIVAGQAPNPPGGGGSGGSGGSGGGSSGGGAGGSGGDSGGTGNDSNIGNDVKPDSGAVKDGKMQRFVDVPETHWASNAINYVAEKGIFKGTSENEFSPSGKMTRAMFITALARYLNGESNSTVKFTDVPADAYYAKAVA